MRGLRKRLGRLGRLGRTVGVEGRDILEVVGIIQSAFDGRAESVWCGGVLLTRSDWEAMLAEFIRDPREKQRETLRGWIVRTETQLADFRGAEPDYADFVAKLEGNLAKYRAELAELEGADLPAKAREGETPQGGPATP
jgi:hypothetical protein